MLCAVVKGPSFVEAESQIQKALESADIVELRLDMFSSIDLIEINRLHTTYSIPKIFTLRAKRQGGSFNGTEQERLAALQNLASIQPEYLDLEFDIPSDFVRQIRRLCPHIIIIISHHNFHETPNDLSKILDEMKSNDGDYYKIATMANSVLDTMRLLVWAKNASSNIIPITMGAHGQLSRIIGPLIGNPITYASLENDLQTAPGQIPVSVMKERYQFGSLNPGTLLYGLIGDPISSSISNITHNHLFKSIHIDAIYVKVQVLKDDLKEFLQLAKEMPFQGLSVTMPLKECIMPHLKVIDHQAIAIGAVNTLKLEQGNWIGYNTDGFGAINAIETETPIQGKKIVVIGAGGAAKAIVYEAIRKKAKVTVLNRNVDKARQIADAFRCEAKSLDEMEVCYKEGYDILINCTSVECPIPADMILPSTVFMDINTRTTNNTFIKEASKKGCRIVLGYRMFIEQAAGQFDLWFDSQVNKQQCLEILGQKARECLVLK